MKIKISYLIALVLLTLGCWLSASFLFGALSPVWLIVLGVAAWLFISAMVWAASKMSAKVRKVQTHELQHSRKLVCERTGRKLHLEGNH